MPRCCAIVFRSRSHSVSSVRLPQSNDLIVREIYLLSSSDQTEFADCVAHKVTTETAGPAINRNWKVTPYLAENETLEPDDCRSANAALKADRSREVPWASCTGTAYTQKGQDVPRNTTTPNSVSNISVHRHARFCDVSASARGNVNSWRGADFPVGHRHCDRSRLFMCLRFPARPYNKLTTLTPPYPLG